MDTGKCTPTSRLRQSNKTVTPGQNLIAGTACFTRHQDFDLKTQLEKAVN
jgi:hypothetical protein